jgi:Asp-tRNA(Asn)/Glu-tRNA(Gln) amidotransferase A subunit family amidase
MEADLKGLKTQAPSSDVSTDATISGLAQSLRQLEISPVEVVAICLGRIERLQPQLNAFITVARESAEHDARAAEAEIGDGRWKGALHGISIGVKDFYDTRESGRQLLSSISSVACRPKTQRRSAS